MGTRSWHGVLRGHLPLQPVPFFRPFRRKLRSHRAGLGLDAFQCGNGTAPAFLVLRGEIVKVSSITQRIINS